MDRFTDKVILVTGATSGMGRSTALAFAAEGAKVIAAGRDEKRGLQLVDEGRARHANEIVYRRTDVSLEEDVEALVTWTSRTFNRLDAAINTAGINPHGSIMDGRSEDFDAIFSTNTKGLFFCLKHQMRALRDTGGALVNINSIGGERFLPNRGLYCASKAAATMLVRAAAVEGGAFGIRVNEISPGTIDTPMLRETWARRTNQDAATASDAIKAKIPLKRLGEADEVAQAVMFLCSDEARYITGARLTIDGGLVLVV
jgi:NAD(P)-dependent dehydrogenase (short-subunit alcohol dehydrogenase family)